MDVRGGREGIESLCRALNFKGGYKAAKLDELAGEVGGGGAGRRKVGVHKPLDDIESRYGMGPVVIPLGLGGGDAVGGRGHHGIESVHEVDESGVEGRVHRALEELELKRGRVIREAVRSRGSVARGVAPRNGVGRRCHGGADV